MSKYEMEIVSRHPQFKEKNLRKYYVDGIDTVGAWGDEPFEIRFKNNTWDKIQLKISVDGTDILTGKPADTEVGKGKDMWVVKGMSSISLKAWPETQNGGAALIFTSANNSVALHTHGDMSNRGIIAAAVFVEGHKEDIIYTYNVKRRSSTSYWDGRIRLDYCNDTKGTSKGAPTGSSQNYSYNSGDFNMMDSSISHDSLSEVNDSDMKELVSVGAGQHVDQKITYVTGLVKPVFTETLRVRYLWWDELVAKLKEANYPETHPSGFPGDKNQQIMSLGNTPRIGERPSSTRTSEPVYSRI